MSRRSDFQAVIAMYVDNTQAQSFTHLIDTATDFNMYRFRINLNGQFFYLTPGICEQISPLKYLSTMSRKRRRGKSSVRQDSVRFSTSHKFSCLDDDESDNLVFDRDPSVFAAIVDYVINHELHVPRDVCPKVFARDLTFWGFSISEVDSCCFPALVHFLIEQDKLNEFQWFLYNKKSHAATMTEYMGRQRSSGDDMAVRAKVWRILNEPEHSLLAKIYFSIMCIFILLSFFSIAAGTHKYFQIHRPLPNKTTPEKQNDTNSTNSTIIDESKGVVDITDTFFKVTDFIVYMEYVCSGYLFLDYTLRIIFFPDLKQFFKDTINITDGLAVISSVAKIIVKTFSSSPDIQGWIQAIDIMQLLRILRFLRPMSKMTWFRLMYFTLRCSYKDLLLVVTLLIFLSMIFASLLYYIGPKTTIRNIPEAMWYSIITMTTVGYGDVVPDDFKSMLIGSVVAVFGVIIMTMTTPIMVANFHSLYINAIIGQPSLLKKVQKQLDRDNPQNSLSTPVLSSSTSLVTPARLSAIPDTQSLRERQIDYDDISLHDRRRSSRRKSSSRSGSSKRSSSGGKKPFFSLGFATKYPDTSWKRQESLAGFIQNDEDDNPSRSQDKSHDSTDFAWKKTTKQRMRFLDKALHNLNPLKVRHPSRIREDDEPSVSKRGDSTPLSIHRDTSSGVPQDNITCNVFSNGKALLQYWGQGFSNENTECFESRTDKGELSREVIGSSESHAVRGHAHGAPVEQGSKTGVAQLPVDSEDKLLQKSSPACFLKPPKVKSRRKFGQAESSRDAVYSNTDILPKSAGSIPLGKDVDNLNQNMMPRNKSSIKSRYRAWHVNHETSDSDVESACSAGDGNAYALDCIPRLEKARVESLLRARRRAVQIMRRKRPRR